jgi:carotenoid cleavage dioxygenase-like enzyme
MIIVDHQAVRFKYVDSLECVMTDLAEPMNTQSASAGSNEAPEKKLPWHLRGNFAPVFDEVTLTDELRVTGSIPKELNGLFVRNGANPKSGKSPHWFFGNGMLHGLQLRDGKADWYRNRYVVTPKLEHPNSPPVNADGSIDRTASACYVFHPMNAYERGTGDELELVLDVGRFKYMWRKDPKSSTTSRCCIVG